MAEASAVITVRALVDFHTGPRAANGSREIAIRAGETREIRDPGGLGAPFWTTTRYGTRFGLCRLGRDHGWEVVRCASREGPRPSVSSTGTGRKGHAPALGRSNLETAAEQTEPQRPPPGTLSVETAAILLAFGVLDRANTPPEDAPEGGDSVGESVESGDGLDDWP